MLGTGIHESMPSWMQMRCMNWIIGKHIPVVCVHLGVATCVNMRKLHRCLHTVGGRFLIYHERQHVMCGRVILGDDGVLTCLFMDTSVHESPNDSNDRIQSLRKLESLPCIIRFAKVDDTCGQQVRESGECVVMGIGNVNLRDGESVNSVEGELIRQEFVILNPDLLKCCATAEMCMLIVAQWNLQSESFSTYGRY
jgi:hypothetical protein